MTKEIQKTEHSIQTLESAKKFSKEIANFIGNNKLSVNIQGKQYVQVEGWQFAGGILGLYPRISEVSNLSNENETKWSVKAEVLGKDGNVVATGFSICSNREMKKRSFDEYAILSMAQTRAIGKAYRNYIGWVVKLAGYEAVPAEEMQIKEVKEVKEKRNKFDLALDYIKKTTSSQSLANFRENIFNNPDLTEDQKGLLVDAIDEKLSA